MTISSRTLQTRIHEGGSVVGSSYVSGLEITVYQCGDCGVSHGLTGVFIKARREDHKTFYCVWCQSPLGFNGESESERTKRLLALERSRSGRLASQLGQTKASLAATKGAVTRIKKERDNIKLRVASGVCPCCGRTFSQLARHMKSKHPDYAESE